MTLDFGLPICSCKDTVTSMKRFLFFPLMLLGALNLVCCSEPKAEQPDELAQRIFHKLKENDQEGYEEMTLYSDSEYLKVFDAIMEVRGEGMSKSEMAEERERFIDKVIPETRKKVSESFSRVRQEAEGDGVDWSKAEYVRATYKIRKKDGLEHTDILITLKSGRAEYQFKLDDCMKFDGEWFFTDDMRWRGNVLTLKR